MIDLIFLMHTLFLLGIEGGKVATIDKGDVVDIFR